jgi:hypothetical protein
MSEFRKVIDRIWTGETGRKIRGDVEAQLVALYLTTCSHSNMIGLYYIPRMYIAHELGLTIEGASKGLRRLIEEGFCHYDEASEVVWVVNMASHQMLNGGKALSPTDKQSIGAQNRYNEVPPNAFLETFYDTYADALKLRQKRQATKPLASPLQAPSEPLARPFEAKAEHSKAETEQSKTPLPPLELTGGVTECTVLKTKRTTNAEKVANTPIPFPLDTPAFRDAWVKWQKHRQEKRSPLTPTSAEAQIKDFMRVGADRAIELMERSIKNGWQGLFEENSNGNGSSKPTPSDTRRARECDGDLAL